MKQDLIQLKSPREIEIMAEGGRILAATHDRIREAVQPGVTTAELDRIAEEFIRSQGAVPAFKGLYGFPGSICTSVNDEVVHGIPTKRRILRAGDTVSIDVGVLYRGYYTDAAVTLPVGEIARDVQRLLDVTQRALEAGIAAAVPNAHTGDIGAAVQKVVEDGGFSVVRDLVGHGIGVEPHESPQVPNYGKPRRGQRLTPGLVIAIEPMVNAGTHLTRTLDDKWTVVTVDGSRSAHFEHTVAITPDGPRVLTLAAQPTTGTAA